MAREVAWVVPIVHSHVDATKPTLIRKEISIGFHCISAIGSSCSEHFISSCSVHHYLLVKIYTQVAKMQGHKQHRS